MKFSVYWNQFSGNACTKLISLWDETSYKQAWIFLRSGSLRLLKFWKQFHTNRHITESRGETLGKRNIQPFLNFSSIEKWQTISQESVTQWDVCACFLRKIFDILGTVVERDRLLSCHLWESIEIDVLFYGHLGEPCLTQIKYFQKV